MAANIILLVLLIILFLVLALFSLNLNIVITFYASTEIQKLYQYAISVRSEKRFLELYRITEERRKKPKRKTQKKKTPASRKLKSNFQSFKPYIEIHRLSFLGEISFGSADHTALAAGGLNAAAGALTALLGSLASKISVSRIDIRPVYDDTIRLNFLFECIVKCNTGNIISTTLNILKGRKQNVKSYQRRHVDRNEQHQGNGGCKHSDRRSCANA
ncbi:MAG TPA: DUF2953 domain-containing protein [Candidatus Egerieisoma faecipullorum]|uniref:DUF2953 domain-containing protein n=1 Tax=Candidatus Egerieisoma faecipullorum TaxID=2840963 RepID=A0A9D1I785_9CLOT|nr:DUF2953 domain-containing protein [Candidatus Egerieisoma faecipullorum]